MTQLDFNELNYSPSKCLTNFVWWKNATRFSLHFSRFCFLPAALWLTSLALVVFPLFFVIKTLNGTIDAARLFFVAFTYFCAAIISIPTMIFSMGLWLMRLTAYCVAFDALPRQDMLSQNLQPAAINAAQKDAVQFAQTKKLFFAKYWSAVTLFLIVPTLFFVVALLVLGSTSTAVVGAAAVKLPMWALTIAYFVLFVTLTFISEVSIVGLFVSGTTDDRDVMNLAKKTVVLCFQHAMPLGAITVVGAVVTLLLTSPGELLHLGQSADTGVNVTWVNVVEEVWRSISSTVVWTLTLSPMCEYLRGKLSESKS